MNDLNKKKIIIDTDCGSDDAMAIAMALNDDNFEILMFSTVSGNVCVEQATINTLITLEKTNSYYPPVYKGADKMLLKELNYAHETHGNDGMGDIGLTVNNLTYCEGNGILKMIDLLQESEQGEIDIIALGPLTNIALAMRIAPDAIRKAGRLIVMGTAGLGAGNVTPVAEFNIWQDAEAAKIVTEFGLEKLIYVGWDACLEDSMLDPSEIKKIRESGDLGKFAIDCNKVLMEMNCERFGDNYLDMADPAAMAAALYPDCIEKIEKFYCEVDVQNGPSYGSVLVDRNHFSGKEPNAYICSKLDSRKYKDYIFEKLSIKH